MRKKKSVTKKTAAISLAGLAGAVTLAAGTEAYAYTVMYENTGSIFQWNEFIKLDITKPATEQLNTVGFSYDWQGYGVGNQYFFGYMYRSTGNRIATEPGSSIYLQTINHGEIIDSNTDFSAIQAAYWEVQNVPNPPSQIIGLKTSGGNYGWALIDFNPSTKKFDALSWGYETQAGVGIAAGPPMVPEPGNLAMLAAGASTLIACKRLRRKKQ